MGWSGIRRWITQPFRPGSLLASSASADELVQRYALLLRPQIADELGPTDRLRLVTMLNDDMSTISDGSLSTSTGQAYGNADFSPEMHWSIEVGEFLIDRFAVSNERYQQFVEDGGYQNDTWWSATSFRLRSKWVDRSHTLSPKDWCRGRPAGDMLNHPVVGICWFEAEAYAKWVGKRLPSEAEWMWAAMGSDAGKRYPWGAEWRNECANIWQSGHERTVPVGKYGPAEGASETYQFIGNVWEWTQTPFGVWGVDDEWGDCREYRAIKGGAFDTLLPTQATIHFQSGESMCERRHNIGFRCALNPRDLIDLQRTVG